MHWIQIVSCLLVTSIFSCCQCTFHTNVTVFQSCARSRVVGSIPFRKVSVTNEISCARACKDDKNCRSANFIHGGEGSQCELLSDSFKTDDCGNLTKDDTSDTLQMVSSVKSSTTCTYDVLNIPCHFGQSLNLTTCQCQCIDGFRGGSCENPPRDCSDFSSDGYKYIYVPDADKKLRAVCTAERMYILQFYKRNDAFTIYMNSSWNEFKTGLNGYGSGQYWVGNDDVHAMTTRNNHRYMLCVTVKKKIGDKFDWIQSEYYDFVMKDEASNYTIYFGGSWISSKGKAVFVNNTQFQTTDYNNDGCSTIHKSAWWYPSDCQEPSPLTGNHSIHSVLTPFDEFVLQLKRM